MKNKFLLTLFSLLAVIFVFGTNCENGELTSTLGYDNLIGIQIIESISLTSIDVTLNLEVNYESASYIENYSIVCQEDSTQVNITSAELDSENSKIIHLQTSILTEGTRYIISIQNLETIDGTFSQRNKIESVFYIPFADELMQSNSEISLNYPINGQSTTDIPAFSWTSQNSALSYTIEIASDIDFTGIVLTKDIEDSSYCLDNDDLTGITNLSDITYYWRVKANYKGGESSYSFAGAFNVVSLSYQENVVYVWNDYIGLSAGNKTAPYSSIQDAIDYASINNISRVNIAQGTYLESLTMRKGISLYGGYIHSDDAEDTDNWTKRDSAVYITTIICTNFYAIFCSGITSSSVIDGLNLDFSADSGAFLGIYCNSSSPVISNNIIRNRISVLCTASSSPTIEGNEIYAYSYFSYLDVIGVDCQDSSPDIKNNIIFCETDTDATSSDLYGIRCINSNPMIINNVISNKGEYVSNNGIYCDNSDPVILNNIINGSKNTKLWMHIIYLYNGSNPQIINNILFSESSSYSSATGIYEADSDSDPVMLVNNNIYAVSVVYYDTDTGDISDASWLNDYNNTTQNAAHASQDNIGQDPIMEDVALDDYHFRSDGTSLCSSTAGGSNQASLINIDLDGVIRTDSWSIGAYEYDGTCVP